MSLSHTSDLTGEVEDGASRVKNVEDWIASYRACYSRLVVIAAAVSGHRAAAEDIVQEAAVVAIQKMESYRQGTNFSAWMAEIVRKCALNFRRKIARRGTTSCDPATLADFPQHGAIVKPEDQSTTLDTWQPWFDDVVWAALRKLSTDARSCLLLRVVHGMSFAEIAQILDMPEGTAMSHVHRARTAMRLALSSSKSIPQDPLSTQP